MAFGQLAEITGASFMVKDIPDTDELKRHLESSFPQVGTIPYKIAINKKIISNNTLIDNHTTIALLPPFSGG